MLSIFMYEWLSHHYYRLLLCIFMYNCTSGEFCCASLQPTVWSRGVVPARSQPRPPYAGNTPTYSPLNKHNVYIISKYVKHTCSS